MKTMKGYFQPFGVKGYGRNEKNFLDNSFTGNTNNQSPANNSRNKSELQRSTIIDQISTKNALEYNKSIVSSKDLGGLK